MNREGQIHSFPVPANDDVPREESLARVATQNEKVPSFSQTTDEGAKETQSVRVEAETEQIAAVRARLQARSMQVAKSEATIPAAARKRDTPSKPNQKFLDRLKFWKKKELSSKEVSSRQEGVALRQLFSGVTVDGQALVVEEIDYERSTDVKFTSYKDAFTVSINGGPLIITAAEKLRDGGSVFIRGMLVSDGIQMNIHLPFMGQPTLNGQPLTHRHS